MNNEDDPEQFDLIILGLLEGEPYEDSDFNLFLNINYQTRKKEIGNRAL